jgi:monoamine oxidase
LPPKQQAGSSNLSGRTITNAFLVEIPHSVRDFGCQATDEDIQEEEIQITRWSLDATSFGAYSVAEPKQWYQREKLAEPVMDTQGTKRLFFAGEGTARAIYNGSYPGAYESGLKAARAINAEMLEEKARKDGRL